MVSQPSVNRGMLILLSADATEPIATEKNFYFTFQYNPEKILHTFNPSIQPASAKETEIQCPPTEYFNLTFELDSIEIEAATQKQIATDYGLHPALAMLELMMQPQVKDKPPSMPILIFKWGQKRLVPVHMISMSAEEKTFDQTLSPTRANVNIILRVLKDSEIKDNQAAKKALATQNYNRSTLVEVYESDTNQVPATGKQGNQAAANAPSVKIKTKLSA